jgi:hypothetical protein
MNNKKLFLKYLDNQLSEIEKEDFDLEIKNNHKLRDEFSEFSKLYKSLKSNLEVDERYFSTIIPNARCRIEKPKPNYIGKVVYFMPVIIIIFFMVINQFSNNSFNENYNFDEFVEDFTQDENLTVALFSSALEHNENFVIENNELLNLFLDDLTMDESVFDYVKNNLSYHEINNEIFNELSENEFTLLFEELKNKKIL